MAIVSAYVTNVPSPEPNRWFETTANGAALGAGGNLDGKTCRQRILPFGPEGSGRHGGGTLVSPVQRAPMARIWSEEEKEKLFRLAKHGVSDREIGRILHRTTNSVCLMRSRLMVPSKAAMAKPIGNERRIMELLPDFGPIAFAYDKLAAEPPLHYAEPDFQARRNAHVAFLIAMLRAGQRPKDGELDIPTDGRLNSRTVMGDYHLSLVGSTALMCAGA